MSLALHHCPKPTVAALQGAVLTMGCEFSLFCDFRVVTPETFFEEKWVRMGVIPTLGGLKLLPLLVGHAQAKRMILKGERIYEEEALAIGLATRCVSGDALQDSALEVAREAAQVSSGAFAKAKALMNAAIGDPLEKVLSAGAQAQAELLTSDEFRARLQRRPS